MGRKIEQDYVVKGVDAGSDEPTVMHMERMLVPYGSTRWRDELSLNVDAWPEAYGALSSGARVRVSIELLGEPLDVEVVEVQADCFVEDELAGEMFEPEAAAELVEVSHEEFGELILNGTVKVVLVRSPGVGANRLVVWCKRGEVYRSLPVWVSQVEASQSRPERRPIVTLERMVGYPVYRDDRKPAAG